MISMTDTTQPVLPLDLMAAGQQGRVVLVDASPAVVQRLAELGIREGAELRMVRPGCPCIVAVDERRFSYRLEASQILVELQLQKRAS